MLFGNNVTKPFIGRSKKVTNIQKLCIQPFPETDVSKSGKRQGREKSRRVKYSLNYIGQGKK